MTVLHNNLNKDKLPNRKFSGHFSVLMLAFLASSSLQVSSSYAATVTSTLGVSITIVGGCVIDGTDDVAFADGDLITDPTPTAQGKISVTCTNGHAYSVGLGAGNGASATVNARKMTLASQTDTISYGLFQNPGHTTVWGETTGGSGNVFGGTGNGSTQDIPVYGKIVEQAIAPKAGNYSDSVAITVTY